MKNFDYEKAYFVQALPAFNNLNERQKMAHNSLLPLVAELNQGHDLNIPLSDDMKAILENLTCQEIAELSRASYFVGHWKPGFIFHPFSNTRGEGWKIANVCDQILRKRLAPPREIEIHEGTFRVTFSGRDCWIWEEFGLATEKNLEIYNSCGLPFGENALGDSAKKLSSMCGDLWGDVDTMEGNQDYSDFLELKKAKKLEALKIKHTQRLADIQKDIENSKIELEAFTWLFNNNIPENLIDNCIYYGHQGQFSFGWRDKLNAEEKEKAQELLKDFPFEYQFA